MLTCRWCSLDVIAASWRTEQMRKKSWKFYSIIMENMRHNLLLFYAPTRSSYHVIEYHLHVIFGQVENLTRFPYFTKCWQIIWLTYDTAIWKRENWFVCVPFGESKHGFFVKSLKNLLHSIQQIQIRNFGLWRKDSLDLKSVIDRFGQLNVVANSNPLGRKPFVPNISVWFKCECCIIMQMIWMCSFALFH